MGTTVNRSYPYPEGASAVNPTVYVKDLAAAVDADVQAVKVTADGKVSSTDPRLTDARTPTAHAASHGSGGSDAVSPSSIGAAATVHTHAIGDVTGLSDAVYWSGWRNVSTLRHADLSGGNLFLARTGRLCMLMIHNLTSATAGHRNIIALPAGFRVFAVSGANWRNGEVSTDDGASVRPVSAYGGNLRVLNMPVTAGMGGTISWLTADAPPAPGTEPGIAA